MSQKIKKDRKKEILKDIILSLHRGLAVEEAKERFEKEIGDISSTEIKISISFSGVPAE